MTSGVPRLFDRLEHLGRPSGHMRVSEANRDEPRGNCLRVARTVAIEIGNSRVPSAAVDFQDDSLVGQVAVDPPSPPIRAMGS